MELLATVECEDEYSKEALDYFQKQMKELVEASLKMNKPIVF